ncbi:hypothetical protein NEOLEDRAFT_1061092 [Neolentinus lepideus HHB14362 ss-1]|uniref:Uncharacterized protein n=1 Tax=Neolentinus lepideus HHB14362 ss-1 TaxID=1314782 RepID=A0A165TXV0_9AGAM|nr:hypothetical protein NEOLEDRAFT_1061092 [Neolentinus lepideus HHB14362 ss-1]
MVAVHIIPASRTKCTSHYHETTILATTIVPFGVTYEKIGTIQRRLAWPLHKDDTLTQSGSSTELNIYALFTDEVLHFDAGVFTRTA